MTPEQIEELGPAFAAYLQQFLFCCDYTQTFALFGVYCRGLLSDLDRKTCEPIALASGTAVRTLQEFLRDHRWSFAQRCAESAGGRRSCIHRGPARQRRPAAEELHAAAVE